jgi:hypothetical protein
VAVGPSQVDLSWSPTPGATSYQVERMTGGGLWVVIAGGVASTSYVDSGLSASTTYQYAVVATSGDSFSGFSTAASVQTGPIGDGLTIQPMVITVARKLTFSGRVAMFADSGAPASPGSFVATIDWGYGRVSHGTVTGSDGRFAVVGRHRFPAAGRYSVRVAVTSASGTPASTSTTSTAAVGIPLRIVKHAVKPVAELARRHRRR